MDDLRKCNCGGEGEIVKEFYPNTKYKLYRIRCKSCGIQTAAKWKVDLAVKEWNNPISVHLN